MTGLLPHKVAWVSAAPLWSASVKTPEVMRRPAILGFGSDTFMDDLLADLARKPAGIAARVASGKSRSYRERQPGESFDFQPTTDTLKLYQPVHGWFYLVTGSLICQLPGLPDHSVDVAAGDEARFVLRRIGDGGQELALVVGEAGAKSWHSIGGAPAALVDGEELLPLFPMGFNEGDRRRRMMAGVIPAASQDALQAAPVAGVTPPATDASGKPGPADALEDVKGRVTNGIRALVNGPVPKDASLQPEASRFILMDLADFLAQYIPAAWNAIKSGGTPSGATGALVTFLRGRAAGGQSLASLVKDVLAFPLDKPYPINLAAIDVSPTLDAMIKTFDQRLGDALAEAQPELANVKDEVQRAGATKYVVRLVYRRPHCGPLQADVVSAPSETFVLAPYFDVDAPSRPIRIAMPFDPSIKGLRQFRKNVKLVLSDALRKKVAGIGKINDNVEGPGFDCGGISLSIPIITICAMIILFIFLNLLNIVFWWLPFVKICFPKIKVEP